MHIRSMSSSAEPPSPPERARRPSPYRLPALPDFLAAFAPLHAVGWRLQVLPGSLRDMPHSAADELASSADLQGRRLVRAYAFPRDRDGWRALVAAMSSIGQVVEDLDHHPLLLAAPASDLPPGVAELADAPDGYVLYVATHTHTPMPPLGLQMEGKPAPGVTGKDVAFAERVERAARHSHYV
ncbi:hypothetical protein CspeluHIS016_0104290 [Cutaneotrichosporon spelunceum]|uniref:Uncharacterized protein n=1 Tax=Cutaneotrichosporon spelunceum TaxID=1672016 RepID=A0AAD3Y9C6_9TREE|nr:hypothetical protein CspeluHIS016_0104290 [Cutaneotrichosporon spelunceum]